MFNYIVRPNPYNIATNPNPTPVDFQMILGWTQSESGITPIASDVRVLFQFGSISTAPTGTLFDFLNPMNKGV